MRASGTELLSNRQGTLKFILNDQGIVFFPASLQHRDIKTPGLSYEDDYRGNALAGMLMPDRAEIRFHSAFRDDRIRALWARVTSLPEVRDLSKNRLFYQGRELI